MSVDVEPSTSKDDRRRPMPTIDLTESQPALAEKKKYVVFVPPLTMFHFVYLVYSFIPKYKRKNSDDRFDRR
ncbi:hypothetical protein OUZ56_026070 [Daphnia magna]|uniref:Uncharacterized protein n=1 Tax=Daphnia magna TaxID=35525 RepID=A0ABQ9ZKR5_9CRUS|nr:hypothetical protein OUZ56_026070 [Daphnia magna]